MTRTTASDTLRADARAIFDAGVAAADPHDVTRRALTEALDRIDAARKVHILAGGKAALAMARAALATVPGGSIERVIAVTNVENITQSSVPEGVEVHVGGHPVPDAGGEAGARAIEDAARAAQAGDLVICLISGGASALLPAPVAGLSLADKIATTQALLRSGADIGEMNTVRTALSRLKGGGLARAAAPADVMGLLLSDVPGDDPATIGSGPSVPVAQDPEAALRVIERYALADKVPAAAMTVLREQDARPDAEVLPHRIENRVIGSNAISLAAARHAADALGYESIIAADWLDGDVGEACRRLVEAAVDCPRRPVAVLAGGETTVHVTGNGKGGRNQELALRFALQAEKAGLARPWVMLSGGTDGRDGPTDAAGGLVDPATLGRLDASGGSAADHLDRNDAYHALAAAGDLLMTGATGTNVADLQIVLLA